MKTTARFIWVVMGLTWAAANGAEPATKPGGKPVEEQLAQRLDVEFSETPFQEVVDFLQEKAQLQFRIDRRAWDAAGLGVDTPVTAKLRQVRLDTLLEFILDDIGELDFGIRDGVVVLSTDEKFSNQRDVQVYSCQKLLAVEPKRPRSGVVGGGGFGAGAGGGEGVGGPGTPATPVAEPLSAIEQLTELILSNIQPESWNVAGGPGSIMSFGDRLVVSNTPRVHRQIKALLERLCDTQK